MCKICHKSTKGHARVSRNTNAWKCSGKTHPKWPIGIGRNRMASGGRARSNLIQVSHAKPSGTPNNNPNHSFQKRFCTPPRSLTSKQSNSNSPTCFKPKCRNSRVSLSGGWRSCSSNGSASIVGNRKTCG